VVKEAHFHGYHFTTVWPVGEIEPFSKFMVLCRFSKTAAHFSRQLRYRTQILLFTKQQGAGRVPDEK